MFLYKTLLCCKLLNIRVSDQNHLYCYQLQRLILSLLIWWDLEWIYYFFKESWTILSSPKRGHLVTKHMLRCKFSGLVCGSEHWCTSMKTNMYTCVVIYSIYPINRNFFVHQGNVSYQENEFSFNTNIHHLIEHFGGLFSKLNEWCSYCLQKSTLIFYLANRITSGNLWQM